MEILTIPSSRDFLPVNSSKKRKTHMDYRDNRVKGAGGQNHISVKIKYKTCVSACAHVSMLSRGDVWH